MLRPAQVAVIFFFSSLFPITYFSSDLPILSHTFWTPGLPVGVYSNRPCPSVCPSVYPSIRLSVLKYPS